MFVLIGWLITCCLGSGIWVRSLFVLLECLKMDIIKAWYSR